MILPSLPPHCSVSEFNTCEPLYQLCGKHNCLSHRFTAAPKQAQAGRAVTCGVISMQVQTFSCGSWQTYFRQASTPSGSASPAVAEASGPSSPTPSPVPTPSPTPSPSPGLDGGPLGADPFTSFLGG